MSTLFIAGLAYLLASFPSGLVLAFLFKGQDVRRHGSGNIGAANVASTAGWTLGATVGVLDVLKGAVPVLIGDWIGLGVEGLAVVALAAVLGHDFSLFLRFHGGKGVATTFGVALVLAPRATLAAMATWLVAWLIWRYASLASLLALAVLPLAMAPSGKPAADVALAIGLFLLGAAKHWENIIRLAHGKEPKAGERRRSRDNERC